MLNASFCSFISLISPVSGLIFPPVSFDLEEEVHISGSKHRSSISIITFIFSYNPMIMFLQIVKHVKEPRNAVLFLELPSCPKVLPYFPLFFRKVPSSSTSLLPLPCDGVSISGFLVFLFRSILPCLPGRSLPIEEASGR